MKLVVQDLSQYGMPINISVADENGEPFMPIFTATKVRHEDDTFDRVEIAEKIVAAFNSSQFAPVPEDGPKRA